MAVSGIRDDRGATRHCERRKQRPLPRHVAAPQPQWAQGPNRPAAPPPLARGEQVALTKGVDAGAAPVCAWHLAQAVSGERDTRHVNVGGSDSCDNRQCNQTCNVPRAAGRRMPRTGSGGVHNDKWSKRQALGVGKWRADQRESKGIRPTPASRFSVPHGASKVATTRTTLPPSSSRPLATQAAASQPAWGPSSQKSGQP